MPTATMPTTPTTWSALAFLWSTLTTFIESTCVRGILSTQLSQVTGIVDGMPETDISVTITACHVLTSPPLQIRTTASGRRGVGRLEGAGPQFLAQPAASRTNAKAELRTIASSRNCLTRNLTGL